MKLEDRKQNRIRNFSIIAHIDHGKSTLADRILESTHSVEKRDMKEQLLDSMDLERERGITIKLNSVKLKYTAKDKKEYMLNLIDTPGHVDFTYEVSRSLAACDGAILVVDATQGIEAQTLANVYLALDNDLEIADIDGVKKALEETLGINPEECIPVSAKTGKGIEDVLEAIIKRVPAPKGEIDKPLQALIFDSFYDPYRGVIPLVMIKNGVIKKGDKIKMMASSSIYEVVDLGIYTPKELTVDFLAAGDVGWISAVIKDIENVHVADTITNINNKLLYQGIVN